MRAVKTNATLPFLVLLWKLTGIYLNAFQAFPLRAVQTILERLFWLPLNVGLNPFLTTSVPALTFSDALVLQVLLVEEPLPQGEEK